VLTPFDFLRIDIISIQYNISVEAVIMKYSPLTIIVLFAVLFVLTACSSAEQVYLIQRDVPEHPTVVVVPATNQLYQAHFANDIEEKVIEAGLGLVERPDVKTMEVSQQAGVSELSDMDQSAQQTAMITERYRGFGETSADYVIQTFAVSDQVRIVKRSSGEVLASFTMPDERGGPQTREEETPLRDALEKLGLPVTEREEEPSDVTTP